MRYAFFLPYVRLTLIAVCLLATGRLSAQNDPDTLRIAARAIYNGQSVVVRWSPVDLTTWKWGNQHGYQLERRTRRLNGVEVTGGQFDSSLVVLATQLKPLEESAWESLVNESNELAGVAAGMIYGDSLDIMPAEGNDMLKIYNKTQEAENRFSFSLFAADQNLIVAEAMGLAWVDNTVQAESEYTYSIRPYDPPVITTVRKGFCLVKTDSAYVLPTPTGLTGQAGDSSVILQWMRDDEVFTSYVVERSDDEGVNYFQINPHPLVSASSAELDNGTLSYTDSLPANDIKFFYRVRGRSPFGIVSEPSTAIFLSGKADPLMALIMITNVEELSPMQLTINWSFPVDKENKIMGFNVLRGDHIDGPFTVINNTLLGASTRSYLDQNPKPQNYYIIRAVDLNQNFLETFPQIGQPTDEQAPSIPGSLTGNCSPDGTATLTWVRSPEDDVMGYRVYMSTVPDGDYAQITSVWINDTTYQYQLNLNTLSDAVYFRVTALDFRQNQSAMSPYLKVLRPDIIAPSAPIISSVLPNTQGIAFTWRLSSSTDVVGYEFQRKEAGATGWSVLITFDTTAPQLAYLDTTASARQWYHYRLVALDAAGNRGNSAIAKAKPINNGLRQSVLQLGVEHESASGSIPARIKLEWGYQKDVDLTGFQIFRGFDSISMVSYRFFPIPLPTQPPGPEEMTVVAGIPVSQYTFYDYDLQFQLALKTSFTHFQAKAPGAVPDGAGGNKSSARTAVTETIDPARINYTANKMAPTKLWYWVMAKFTDGSTSPVAGPVKVGF